MVDHRPPPADRRIGDAIDFPLFGWNWGLPCSFDGDLSWHRRMAIGCRLYVGGLEFSFAQGVSGLGLDMVTGASEAIQDWAKLK